MTVNDRVIIDNIQKTDLHMHTIYCDGRNTPEEMVLSAISKGMECIGFSGHSYVDFDRSCGMNSENEAKYFKEVGELKEKYKDRIRIFCGIEQDYCSENDTSQYDYIIGSVHYIPVPGGFASVDDTPEIFKNAVKEYYENDYYKAAEKYYELVSDVVRKTGADIIGHFDLFSKFNEKEHLFDENDHRYVRAWRSALDKLIPQDRIFEINTGAVSRGWRIQQYPSDAMISYISSRGGRFILSSDSHNSENIGYGFERFKDICTCPKMIKGLL